MPITGAGTITDARRPKYADTDLAGVIWSMMDYGSEPFCLVGTADNAALNARADVTAMSTALDTNLSAASVTSIKTALEAQNIPSNWVTTANTYRQFVRVIAGLFSLLQRFAFYSVTSLFSGNTLTTTFGTLSATMQGNILSAAADLGLSTAGLTASTTIRQMLVSVGQQYASKTFTFNNLTV